MENELKFTKSQLGLFDTALLLPYALIQVGFKIFDFNFKSLLNLFFFNFKTFFGQLGDKFGARRTFGYCLIAAGLAMVTFGNWSSFNVLAFLLFLNGSFQVFERIYLSE